MHPSLPAGYYASQRRIYQLHSDATEAAAADFDLGKYDVLAVYFPYLGSLHYSEMDFAGMAEIRGTKIWANGEFDFRVMAHEIGHIIGLWHADFWQSSTANPISPNGSSVEYGDPFDTTGANRYNGIILPDHVERVT